MNAEQIRAERARKRRQALYRFRAVVRLVILNRHWLMDMEDQKLGPNIKRNIALITRRKGKKGILSINEKALLKKSPESRTPAERRRLVSVIASLKCFARYPPRVRSRLARVCFYMYYEAGKVIVKEGHKAGAMYFILDGEIIVTQRQLDPLTNEYVERQVGIMEPGDMFGEVALLDKTERTATCICGTNVELLCVYSTDFDKILRDTLQAQWDQIILAIQRFDIFKNWTKTQIRECCILGKITEYDPLQMVYYEDKSLLNFVYFLLSGQCTLLQCLKIRAKTVKSEKQYQLSDLTLKIHDSQDIMSKLSQAVLEVRTKARRSQSTVLEKSKSLIDFERSEAEITRVDRQTFLRDSGLLGSTEFGLKPRGTDTSKQDISEMFEPDPNDEREGTTTEYHFINIGSMTCGAIFGLGERMDHRMIMAATQVQCLLIPRFWLMQKSQNVANIWRRTQMHLETTIPSREALFAEFLANRKWRNYKKALINSIVSQRPVVNHTKAEDIPIICRIVEAND